MALNRALVLLFDRDVDPGSVEPGSIQIREGPSFGRTVKGTFLVQGAEVRFQPDLPVSCDLNRADHEGLRPGGDYRITVVGWPEDSGVRAERSSKPLDRTRTFSFRTRKESAARLFDDMVPAALPEVLSTPHADGQAAVAVHDGNAVRVALSEGIEPCSVNAETVRFHVYEWGDPTLRLAAGSGRLSGFSPVADNSADPYSWESTAAGVRLTEPQRIPAETELRQDYESTELVIRPLGGRFPENALLVVELTTGLEDFGGHRLVPRTISFTTENLPPQERRRLLEFEGEKPCSAGSTRASRSTWARRSRRTIPRPPSA